MHDTRTPHMMVSASIKKRSAGHKAEGTFRIASAAAEEQIPQTSARLLQGRTPTHSPCSRRHRAETVYHLGLTHSTGTYSPRRAIIIVWLLLGLALAAAAVRKILDSCEGRLSLSVAVRGPCPGQGACAMASTETGRLRRSAPRRAHLGHDRLRGGHHERAGAARGRARGVDPAAQRPYPMRTVSGPSSPTEGTRPEQRLGLRGSRTCAIQR